MKARHPILMELMPALQSSVDLISAQIIKAQSNLKAQRFVFTGTEHGVGNTVLAAATSMNIASHAHQDVVHVEASVEAPRLAGYLGLPPIPGLSELLAGEASAKDCTRELEGFPTLRIIPGGSSRLPVPGEWAMKDGIAFRERLGKHKGPVILDAPPITKNPESRTLIEWADAVIIILRARSSKKDTAREALHYCEAVGTPVLGAVLNRFKPERAFWF